MRKDIIEIIKEEKGKLVINQLRTQRTKDKKVIS